MKDIGYLLFALLYYFFRLFPIKEKQVFCIMTHDGSKDSSVGVVVSFLKKEDKGYEFRYLRRRDTKLGFSFFVKKSYDLARSAYILQDNIFLPMAYIRFSKKVKVVQLWHGTGTIKKFGQSVNEGRLRKLEAGANSTITHLIVNSKDTKELYQEAFGISSEKIYLLGLPRTDLLFSLQKKEQYREEFYQEYPGFKGKKIILYAPTFRDKEVKEPKIEMDITKFLSGLPEEYILILKLHPFVASGFRWEEDKFCGRVWNLSEYNNLTRLLVVSDILITDYSSIIFEYCVLEKPMVFFAYDLEDFSENGRGFYYNYQEYVPGPVCTTTEEMVEIIKNKKYSLEKVNYFKNKSYEYLDGKANRRLYDTIFH